MKKIAFISTLFLTTIFFFSCHKKKLIEVVEVPLPKSSAKTNGKIQLGKPEDVSANDGSFEMVKLEYQYTDLQPAFGALAMETHYAKTYLSYTNNLNKLIDSTDFKNAPIEDILSKLKLSDTDLKNYAGGYYNHTLFFENLATKEKAGKISDTLANSIIRDFGTFDDFKTKFTDESSKQVGSGWTWLISDKNGKLQITSTINQENPLMSKQLVKGVPIIGLDAWEHSFYLDYQNRKKEYITNFFSVLNWSKINERYETAIKK